MPGASEAQEKPQQPVPFPTGTVTFLFTDIEGSTQRWEQHREAMQLAVARHEQIMKGAVARYGGFVFKTMGDAFCVAFPTAPHAIQAAVDAQAALAKEDFAAVDGLRVRMAVHTGDAEERNADYFGPAVNRVARLMSIGHGGQLLISGATHALAHAELPGGVSLSDLGTHRLKDLGEPEHVWQLTIAGLPSIFPPLKSLDELPNNLPIQPTSFRGRDHDLDEVKTLLGEHRVLTLVGSGGIGKTRVALQVGADSLDHFPDGVWFADVAPITDPELVSSIVANALGIEQVQGQRVDELIPQRLKRKKLLLIVDNCEHLLGAVALVVDAIHRNAPDVRVLATSRQALGIPGEAAHRLPSLAVPEPSSTLNAAEAMHYGSIAVFVDRARLADTRFVLTNDNVPIVAEICRRLDGIPLAIELAAARVKVLSVPNLAQRLNERFKILTGGSRTALPRQKTLTALIDWSYDLLSPQEQLLFTRLSIFAGGFGLDAATTVCGGEGLDEIEVLDLLSSLTDKSLVVADTAGERERYHLLESTRAYALDKLVGTGQREQLARHHAEYFRDVVEAADEHYGTGSTFAWVADVERDLDNYRAALEWSITQGNDEVVGSAIAGHLGRLWSDAGLAVEGRYWTGLALKRVSEAEHPKVAARLWRTQASLSFGKDKLAAAEHAFGLYESVGNPLETAFAMQTLADGLWRIGRIDEAEDINNQALEACRRLGNKRGITNSLIQQALIALTRGNSLRARDLYTQVIEGLKALGDQSSMAVPLGNLAEVEFQEGRPDEAVRLASETLEIDRQGKNKRFLAIDNGNLSAYRIALGDVEGAYESARQCLRLARELEDHFQSAIALQHIALIAALRRHAGSAARLVGYVNSQYETLGQQRESTERWGYDKLMSALREQLSEAEIEKLVAEGAAWSEDQAVEEALKA